MSDYFICPVCGADVPAHAAACPECGSDDETGWSEETAYDGFYLMDDEPLPQKPAAGGWTRWITISLALLLIVALLGAVLDELGLLLALALLAVGGGVMLRRQRAAAAAPTERRLYDALLRKARGDDALVERLIAYEARRHPTASRRQLLQDAIDRWERDNR